ncbi:MAG: NAD+ synthase [Desulfobacterales bacterium]|nr:NAD+ synthase [Desulfobacterales bacterium]
MKIGLAQINPVIGDFAHNRARIVHWAERARDQGCELVVFPELALCGYPPQDLLERASFLVDHDRALGRLMRDISGIGVLCGILERHADGSGKPLHNSAVLFEEGEILFTARKQLLPVYDVFDESRYFSPGTVNTVCHYKGLFLGVTICEDVWNDKDIFNRRLYELDPVAELAGAEPGLNCLINLSASPFHLGKNALKDEIFGRLCQRYNLPLLYVNQVGGQDDLLFDGRSRVLDPAGRVIVRAARFQEDLVVVNSDAWSGSQPLAAASTDNNGDEVAAVFEALVMGVRDYVGKCGFSSVVLGLSGGIDSALTCVIACAALGAENVLGVALPSPYTSRESIEDARALAANLGCNFELVRISPVFSVMRQTLAPLFAGRAPDVTEQNLQARIRGNLLMALSNKFGHLLLSTGNKSEMAVGYCTLYGDMSGGLAVIGDVPKLLVYQLAGYVNRDQELIPGRTITKPPSAELAPNQRDEDDLPPYAVLDPILAAYLEQDRSVDEIVALGFDRATVADVVRRIRINEYKRKQAPPVLKVTTKAFGQGRRYPTAQNYLEGA